MVVQFNIPDILLDSSSLSSLTLPAYKENPLELHFNSRDCSPDEVVPDYNGKDPVLPFAASDVFQASVKDCRRLTALDEGCKAVYEVTLDITGSNFTFRPGDTIGIIPRNDVNEVEAIIDHLNLTSQAELPYTLSVNTSSKGGKIPLHIPAKSTLRHALTYCCDIRSMLKKLFLLSLSRHTKDENEKRILEYLCSKEGANAYTVHVLDRHLNILDIFTAFKSCRPPVEVLLANLPRLLPRPYSIVNSGLVNSDIIKICFSVNELANNRKGLVTGWLERIINSKSIEDEFKTLNINDECRVNHKVPIYMRKNMSYFTLPEDLETPLVLIGPGTGISPFIGFLDERQHIKRNQPEIKLGEVWVFFGCRNPKLDFVYEHELNAFLESGIITKLNTSFSRVNDASNKYIQDAIMKSSEDLVKLINNGAAIFVCGDLKNMAVQVKETFVQCLVKHDGRSVQDAEKALSDMQAGKRYLVDAWS